MEEKKSFLKKHKKKIIVSGIILAVIIFFMVNNNSKSKGTVIPKGETVKLVKKDFVKSVSENGTVFSEESVDVFAQKALPVSEILVKVGDTVEKGDVLARLDASSINRELDSAKAGISDTKKSQVAQIKNAREKYNEAQAQDKSGTNPQVLSAISQAESAQKQWQQSVKTYEDFKRSLEEGYNEAIVAANNQKKSLTQLKEQAELLYNQAMERQRENKEKISRAERDMQSSRLEADKLREAIRSLEWQSSQLKSQESSPQTGIAEIMQLENQLNSALAALEELKKNPPPPGSNDPNQQAILQKEQEIKQLRAQLALARAQREQALIAQQQAREMSQRAAALSIEQQNLQSKLTEEESKYSQAKAIVDAKGQTVLQSEQEVEQLKKSFEIAKVNLETAMNSDLTSEKSRRDTLETYRLNSEALKNSYETALKNVETAKAGAKSELRLLKSSLDLATSSVATASAETNVKYLTEDLKKAEIIAPISGTVTSVDLLVGQVPQGSAARIETVKKTIVISNVTEYDLYNIKKGMKAEITGEASQKTIVAKVQKINPTPKKSEGQKTDVRYEVELYLSPEDQGSLVPGLTVRVKYIMTEKKGALTIPSNAIYDKNDKSFVLAVENGKIIEVPVKTVLENDFETVVELDNKYKSLSIITSPENYSAGMDVSLEEDLNIPVMEK